MSSPSDLQVLEGKDLGLFTATDPGLTQELAHGKHNGNLYRLNVE